MDNKQILKEINDLNVNDMKKLFHSYLVKTAQNIQDAKRRQILQNSVVRVAQLG